MIKLVIFLTLFISFVYTNNEQSLDNVSESRLTPGEVQTKLGEEKKSEEKQKNLHSIIDDTIEEKLMTSPCKVDVFNFLSNNEESSASTNKNDTKLETNSTDNKNSTKTSRNKYFESNNEGNKDQTINTQGRKRAATGLFQDTLPTRRILPGIVEKPSNQELKDHKLNQKQALHDNDNLWNSRRNLFPNIDEISSNYDSEKVKKRNVNEAIAQGDIEDDSSESKFMEPTIGKGIFDMKNTKVMLMENARVCYACSTMSNPTCWSPDKRTTVKYCRKGHQSCLTKTFQHKGTSLVIRDCGTNCENQNANTKYNTCTVCHSDLCNGTSAIMYNTSVAIIIFIGIMFNRH